MIAANIKQSNTLVNGLYGVYIDSITEGIGEIIFNLKCQNGQIAARIPINKHGHSILCKMAFMCGINEGNDVKLIDLVGRYLDIEIINSKIKYFSAYGELTNPLKTEK